MGAVMWVELLSQGSYYARNDLQALFTPNVNHIWYSFQRIQHWTYEKYSWMR